MISVSHPRRENAARAAPTWRKVSPMSRSSLKAGMMTEIFTVQVVGQASRLPGGRPALDRCDVGETPRAALETPAPPPLTRGMQGGRAYELRELLSDSGVCFPLTPTLSLGEREHQSTALANPNGLRFADRRTKIPPLPKGEGWGEGEGRFLLNSCR